MWPNPQFPADLVTFTIEIVNAKNFIFCGVFSQKFVTTLSAFTCPKSTVETPKQCVKSDAIGIILVSLLLNLNIFHTLFWRFHCWPEQVNAGWYKIFDSLLIQWMISWMCTKFSIKTLESQVTSLYCLYVNFEHSHRNIEHIKVRYYKFTHKFNGEW